MSALRFLPLVLLVGCGEPPAPPWIGPTPEPDPRQAYFAPQMSVDVRLTVDGDAVTADWTVTYWDDVGDGLVSCQQRFTADGAVERGAGVTGCDDCSARLRFDGAPAQERTDPLVWPDDCDRVWLRDSQWDFGARPFVPGGELLDLLWMSAEDHARTGLDLSGQGLTSDVLSQAAEAEGLAYGGVLLVDAAPGTLAEGIGLVDAVDGPDADGAWRPWAWVLARDPQSAAALDGPVSGIGLWIIQFQTNEGG